MVFSWEDGLNNSQYTRRKIALLGLVLSSDAFIWGAYLRLRVHC
jgi:hypothetical protein